MSTFNNEATLEALLLAAREGGEEAAWRVVLEIAPLIEARIRRNTRLRGSADARDAAQQAAIWLSQEMESIARRWDPAQAHNNALPWLRLHVDSALHRFVRGLSSAARTAVQPVADVELMERGEPGLDADWVTETFPAPDAPLEAREQKATVERAISTLKPGDQRLARTLLEGGDTARASADLGITPSALYKRSERIRNRLRAWLSRRGQALLWPLAWCGLG